MGIANPAFAATINVTTNDDELDLGVDADGDCSLREAIHAANTNGPVDACASGDPGFDGGDPADTIELAANEDYDLTLAGFDDTNEVGDLDILDDLTIEGHGSTIDGSVAGDRVLHLLDERFLILNDTTVQGGFEEFGGGIFNEFGFLAVDGSTIGDAGGDDGNFGFVGGGIANFGVLLVTDSEVTGNTAFAGGGIFTVADFGIFPGRRFGTRDDLRQWRRGPSDAAKAYLEGIPAATDCDVVLDFSSGFAPFAGATCVLDSHIDGNDAAFTGGGISNGLAEEDAAGALVVLQDSTVNDNTVGGFVPSLNLGRGYVQGLFEGDFNSGGGIANAPFESDPCSTKSYDQGCFPCDDARTYDQGGCLPCDDARTYDQGCLPCLPFEGGACGPCDRSYGTGCRRDFHTGVGPGPFIDQNLLVFDSEISGNVVIAPDGEADLGPTEAVGGGLVNSGGFTIDHSTLSSNRVQGGDFNSGGGIFTVSEGFCAPFCFAIGYSTISDNVAQGTGPDGFGDADGGGLWSADNGLLFNSTVSGNQIEDADDEAAGGIFQASFDVPWGAGAPGPGGLLLDHVTVANNSNEGLLPSGPGATIVTHGTLVAGNGTNCGGLGQVLSEGYNLESALGCFDDDNDPTDQPNGDADLDPLFNYGGPTETHRLDSNSDAIDAIPGNECPPPVDDQRGEERPADGDDDGDADCDIGAFEVQPTEVDDDDDDGPGPRPSPSPSETPTPTPTPTPSGTTSPEPILLRLTPEEATNPIGTDHVFTALVTDGSSNPVSGVTVLWSITGVGTIDPASSVTDANGIATATVHSDVPGSTVITAQAVGCLDDSNCIDISVKNWGPEACTILGTEGDDVLVGTEGDDVICGLGGKDHLTGNGGNDLILGGAGSDTMFGNLGNDLLHGGRGFDRLAGGLGTDTLLGKKGQDSTLGGDQADVAKGGQGNDNVRGGRGPDTLAGDFGSDLVTGGPGVDHCTGGPGFNALSQCES